MSKLVFILVLVVISTSNGHIRVIEPPQRSSVWRDPRFASQNPVENTKDDAIYCGPVYQLPSVDNCGVCGDRLTDPTPRANEHGGTYGQGIITGNYRAGQEMPVNIEVTIPHGGSFNIRLCDQVPETDACFMRYLPLPITTDEDGTVTDIPIIDKQPKWINGTVKLPTGVKCEHCVLRLNYRGSDQLGECEDGTQDYGCGLQQNFRNCIDISAS